MVQTIKNEMENLQSLSVHPDDVGFVEALLKSKGFMFVRKEKTTFPFSEINKGWDYYFRCDTMIKIEIHHLLSQIP